MYKEDRSRLIAGLLKIVAIFTISVLIILSFRYIRQSQAAGNMWGVFFGVQIFVFWILCLAAFLAPPLAEKISGSLFNLLYPEPLKVSKTYSAANVFLVKEKYAEAIKEYRKVIEEDPEDITAQLKMAEIYDHKTKDFAKAIQEYKKLLTMKEVEDNLWVSVKNRLADIYSQQLENREETLRQLQQIIERFPGTKYSHQALQRISKLKEANKTS